MAATDTFLGGPPRRKAILPTTERRGRPKTAMSHPKSYQLASRCFQSSFDLLSGSLPIQNPAQLKYPCRNTISAGRRICIRVLRSQTFFTSAENHGKLHSNGTNSLLASEKLFISTGPMTTYTHNVRSAVDGVVMTAVPECVA